MYGFFLALHLLGAVATGSALLYVVYILFNAVEKNYRTSAMTLGALACFEILTGTILSVLSTQLSAAAVCQRIAVYLAVVSIFEAILFVRMQKHSMLFPMRGVISPIAASLMMLASAVAYGF